MARTAGVIIATIAHRVLSRLRSVGKRNLELAFPDMPAAEYQEAVAYYAKIGKTEGMHH